MGTGQCKEAPLPPLHGVGRATGRQSECRLQRAGWHLNGLVFDWPPGLKHWRATPLDRMDY